MPDKYERFRKRKQLGVLVCAHEWTSPKFRYRIKLIDELWYFAFRCTKCGTTTWVLRHTGDPDVWKGRFSSGVDESTTDRAGQKD